MNLAPSLATGTKPPTASSSEQKASSSLAPVSILIGQVKLGYGEFDYGGSQYSQELKTSGQS